LTYSGNSIGTFYNYFSSKNELLIALFKKIIKKLNQKLNILLIGGGPEILKSIEEIETPPFFKKKWGGSTFL
jgi:AcrR family transcriptional regulator